MISGTAVVERTFEKGCRNADDGKREREREKRVESALHRTPVLNRRNRRRTFRLVPFTVALMSLSPSYSLVGECRATSQPGAVASA